MESVIRAKKEDKENIEKEIEIKTKTTTQILKGLNDCLGVTKRTKGILKMYADYIKLYKQKKIKIGNFNILLYCDNNNYRDTVNVINSLLYKEGITKFSRYELITDLHTISRCNLGDNDLCVIVDENMKEYKLEKLMSDYPNCVFVVVCNDNSIKMIENITYKFTWEIEVAEPTEQEKITYIRNAIKEHNLECKVTSAELGAITGFDLEEINSFLIGAILRAYKKKLTYISKEELHIAPMPPKEGMNKLDKLVGLENVKEQVKQIINYITVHKKRETLPMLHMAFRGNPRNR